MSEFQPNAYELSLFRRIVAFFALKPEDQLTLLADFDRERYFDISFEGHIRTQYPLTICVLAVRYYSGKFINYPDYCWTELMELNAIAQLTENKISTPIPGDYWSDDFWKVTQLAEPGAWSVVRRLCASVLDKLPYSEPIVIGEMDELLNEF